MTNSADVSSGNPARSTEYNALRKDALAGYTYLRSESSTPYTATATDRVILVDASGGDATINLPTAVGISGKEYVVKKTDASAYTVTVAPDGAETIDGEATLVIGTQYDSYTLVSDGSNWMII